MAQRLVTWQRTTVWITGLLLLRPRARKPSARAPLNTAAREPNCQLDAGSR
ncbi:MAG: hypothetical protein ACI90M_002224 [Candidatus Azotimanducaceae bacterium]